MPDNNIIIYSTIDGKASVKLYAQDGTVWMNQNQMAELFDTSKQNIGQHIAKILSEKELDEKSVVKNYLTTAADGKQYNVTFYAKRKAYDARQADEQDLKELKQEIKKRKE